MSKQRIAWGADSDALAVAALGFLYLQLAPNPNRLSVSADVAGIDVDVGLRLAGSTAARPAFEGQLIQRWLMYSYPRLNHAAAR